MKRIIIMGLGIAAIAVALWIPTLGASGYAAPAFGQEISAAANGESAQLAAVGQEHSVPLLTLTGIGILALGLVTVIGTGRRRA